jgi:tRNA A37 methylthiotransferase MiaB
VHDAVQNHFQEVIMTGKNAPKWQQANRNLSRLLSKLMEVRIVSGIVSGTF